MSTQEEIRTLRLAKGLSQEKLAQLCGLTSQTIYRAEKTGKITLSNYYINWIGSIYKGEVYEKKWRDFFFWQPYTHEQVQSLGELCFQLTDTLRIERRSIGHNTKIDGITKWNGIISRSNIDSKYTDLNPSFNFESFTKFFENEQQYAE